MRKKSMVLPALLALLSTGCGQESTEATTVETTTAAAVETTVEETSTEETGVEAAAKETETARSLVVWFSLAGEQYDVGVIEEGNTEIVGKYIAEVTGSDTFAIEPVTPYPETLTGLFSVAEEETEENARPEYIGDMENWEDYDTIYLGFPLWYDDMPMIVYSFLEDHDFTGKTICPFDTCGSEGLMDTVETIRDLTGANVTEGLSVRGVTVQNDPSAMRDAVDAWLREIS